MKVLTKISLEDVGRVTAFKVVKELFVLPDESIWNTVQVPCGTFVESKSVKKQINLQTMNEVRKVVDKRVNRKQQSSNERRE